MMSSRGNAIDRRYRGRRLFGALAGLLFATAAIAVPSTADADSFYKTPEGPRNGFGVFYGVYTPDTFSSIFIRPWDKRFENLHYVEANYTRRLLTLWDALDLEVEAGVGMRFGDVQGFAGHAALAARWTDFPWNDVVKTTFGVAFLGPSYVSEFTGSEVKESAGGSGEHWLNYFSPEFTFADPEKPETEFLVRVHHRSGMFHLLGNEDGSTNFIGVGMRRRF